jgi:hypothetical protein
VVRAEDGEDDRRQIGGVDQTGADGVVEIVIYLFVDVGDLHDLAFGRCWRTR